MTPKEKLSMPCTQEQLLNEIEPRLKEFGVNITSLFSFERYPYITNNFESNNNLTGTPNFKNGEAVFLGEDGRICSLVEEYSSVNNVKHKFEGKTTTGYDIEDIIEWNYTYIVKFKYHSPKLFCTQTLESINHSFYGVLIPRNHEKDALKQQIEEKEKELKELNDKLNKLN